MRASISLVFGTVSTVAVLIATPVVARYVDRRPITLDNPYGWPCPLGYRLNSRRGVLECTIDRALTGVVGAERERWLEESKRSAEEWPAKLAKEKQRREAARVEQEAERAKREAEQEAERVKQETERDQLEAREAEAEERAAEERIRAAEERQRAAEAKRPAIEAAAEERRRAAEERRLAAEKATAAKQRAAEAERRAAEEERRNLDKTQRATEEERRALAAERAAAATEQQAKREAEARERHRLGNFGEEDLRNIVHAADHNTVRFERDYKGRTFSGVGAFKHAGKANLT